MTFKYSILIGLILLLSSNAGQGQQLTYDEIDSYWQTGKTLPVSVAKQYPLLLQPVVEDNGLNVMIDLAHQCKFATMWGLPRRLNNQGFRAIGNQAALNSVLDANGKCRVRMPWDETRKIYPFAWYPNFEYNVIITSQTDLNAQNYLPEEQEALVRFVNEGGGLIIFGTTPTAGKLVEEWSLNQLSSRFGAKFTSESDAYRDVAYATISCNNEWEVKAKGEKGNPVVASRQLGKGKVIVVGHEELLSNTKGDELKAAEKDSLLVSLLQEAATGKDPVGGEPRYPMANGGGGGIYPELEKQFNDIVLFYAANQKPELIQTVNQDVPKAKELIEGWLPSKPTLEPMYLVLSSGGGGGWAVNAYKPKENGIISLSPKGIISIFAHELAHTMHGPVNDEGNVAGVTPIPNRGEAHAGWFQGKVDAWFDTGLRDYPVKKCNRLFDFDSSGDQLDLVTHYENEKLREKYGKGKDWTKTWWIWQKLDDQYGPTWYPRWKYVQHTRWKETPMHRLTWDEMVEDMSIAVGEDLFPFMRSAGLSLQKQRLEKVEFNGKIFSLNAAPIEVSEGGVVKLEKIGDYKQKFSAE